MNHHSWEILPKDHHEGKWSSWRPLLIKATDRIASGVGHCPMLLIHLEPYLLQTGFCTMYTSTMNMSSLRLHVSDSFFYRFSLAVLFSGWPLSVSSCLILFEIAYVYQILHSISQILTIVHDMTVISMEITPLKFVMTLGIHHSRSLPLVILLVQLIDFGSRHFKGG